MHDKKIKTWGQYIYWLETEAQEIDFLSGASLPSGLIHDVFLNKKFTDQTPFDTFFVDLCKKMKKTHGENFYIIVSTNDEKTIKHEFAHFFFDNFTAYQAVMGGLLNNLPKALVKKIHKYLKELGYHKIDYKTEAQAYLSSHISMKVGYYGSPFKYILNAFLKDNDVDIKSLLS